MEFSDEVVAHIILVSVNNYFGTKKKVAGEDCIMRGFINTLHQILLG
jgi:hypothetical protein